MNNEELHNLYSSQNTTRVTKSRRMRWVGHVASMWDEKCIWNFSRKTWSEETTCSPRLRWEDNIKLDLVEIGYEDVDWIYVPQDSDQRW